MNTFAKFGTEAGNKEDEALNQLRATYIKLYALHGIVKKNGGKYSVTLLQSFMNQLADMDNYLTNGLGQYESFMEQHNK